MFQEIRMAINKRLVNVFVLPVFVLPVFVLIALMLVMLIAVPASGWAAGASSNQAINQAASLVAPEPDAKITIYRQPEANRQRVGYGVSGDTVTVLEQVSDNQSVIWNHVRFDDEAAAEGWVQSKFLSLTATDRPSQRQQMADGNGSFTAPGTRYLGNQRSPSSQPSQQSANQRPQFNRQDSSQSYDAPPYSQRNQN